MKKIIVQLNHPGPEKKYNAEMYAKEKYPSYVMYNGQLIRDWNTENIHYRKLILNSGKYLDCLSSDEKNAELIFWGEWEAPSVFIPFENKEIAQGLHCPIVVDETNSLLQNTDPYVFGSNFKYAICSQTGVMTQLAEGSLVLFGSTSSVGFLLDTVFVVKNSEIANSVYQNQASNYSKVYKKVTLDCLGNCYLTDKCTSSKNRIYSGKSWSEDKNYFSFVPCKIADSDSQSNGIEKLIIPHEFSDLSFNITRQRQGHPYNHFKGYKPEDVWLELIQFVLSKGFYIGTYLEEPTF